MSDDLLPSNATSQERALAGAVSRLSDVPVPVRDVWNPQACPADLLPWLAWAFSVDAWNSAWPETQKRQVIQSAIVVQQHKGTVGALRDAMEAIGLDIDVVEWFQRSPAGDPYTFRLNVGIEQYGLDADGLRKLLSIVQTSKNLRSWLEELILTISSPSDVYIAGVSMIGTEITIPYGGDQLVSDGFAISDGTYKSIGYKVTA